MARGMRSSVVAAVLVSAGIAVAACGQVGNLKAKKHFKDGTALYQTSDYRAAATEYEEVVASDPNYPSVYFYLANCYDQLYKPARKGEPENDSFLQKAVTGYEKAVQQETEPTRKKRALQYLSAMYGSDKLNDPNKAEPIIKQIIDMDPTDTSSYFGLAKLYEDAGRFDEAERVLLQAKSSAPNQPDPLSQLANFYNKRGEFDKAVQAYEEQTKLVPNDPQVYWRLSAFYYEKVSKDYRIPPKQQVEYIDRGLAAADKALSIKKDFVEALTYKNLLLRQQARLEKDPAKQKALIAQADDLLNQAKELNKLKQKGAGA
jgi:tetratricopeptide (TPR) repeat protein